MKCYITKQDVRLVGKAWQIRHQLRRWQREHDRAPLSEFLAEAGQPIPNRPFNSRPLLQSAKRAPRS